MHTDKKRGDSRTASTGGRAGMPATPFIISRFAAAVQILLPAACTAQAQA
jgi:hypothetical protein